MLMNTEANPRYGECNYTGSQLFCSWHSKSELDSHLYFVLYVTNYVDVFPTTFYVTNLVTFWYSFRDSSLSIRLESVMGRFEVRGG